ncbi:hypothetical protein DSO57_1032493 [Entomophthora muscae]|uniref:Uncharacterized protein n=1 Tax=Entomophthora muscae TaxID=34485 RepID=A0ACC2UL24_9FUNG|nr:hypothetical protein DSO57_1032493 [Entomophthora muscae]
MIQDTLGDWWTGTPHAPFSVMLKNLHSTIQGLVIDFPKFDIVLGLDWLQKNNPHIDWAASVLTIKREVVNH